MPHLKPDNEALKLSTMEEELQVGRRVVDTHHTLRVRKQVHEEPAEFQGEATSDVVEWERVPVGRVVDTPPQVREEGNVTVIPVVEERLLVTRQLVLVEELRLVRPHEVRPVTAATTLRKEQVIVERQDPDTGKWSAESGD